VTPHPYACRCAGCTARAALALLETGRAAATRPLLAGLPDLIVEELGRAYARGHDAAVAATRAKRDELRRLDDRIARAKRELEELERRRGANAAVLAEALAAGRITVERVAEVLKVRPADIPPIAEGRVGLGETARKRLLRELPA
jgi:hypothetical protein